MSSIDTDWLDKLIEQVRTAEPPYSRYFQNELDHIFRRVHTAPGRIPGDDARRPRRRDESDGLTRSHDWRLGFTSALSGWTNIPPAGADRESWLAGWQAGRAEGRQRERQTRGRAGREPAALSG